jgi:hypothetical protein
LETLKKQCGCVPVLPRAEALVRLAELILQGFPVRRCRGPGTRPGSPISYSDSAGERQYQKETDQYTGLLQAAPAVFCGIKSLAWRSLGISLVRISPKNHTSFARNGALNLQFDIGTRLWSAAKNVRNRTFLH